MLSPKSLHLIPSKSLPGRVNAGAMPVTKLRPSIHFRTVSSTLYYLHTFFRLLLLIILQQIKSRTSHGRATIKDAVRSKVKDSFGFIAMADENSKTARCNRQRYENLMEDDAFLYKVCTYFISKPHTNLVALSRTWRTSLASIKTRYFSKHFRMRGSPTSKISASNFRNTSSQSLSSPSPWLLLLWVTKVWSFLISNSFFCPSSDSVLMSGNLECLKWPHLVRRQSQMSTKSTSGISRNGITEIQQLLVRFGWECSSVHCRFSSFSSHLYICSVSFLSRNCGGTVLEATSRLSSSAKAHALKELEGRTGDTDSEAERDDDQDSDK